MKIGRVAFGWIAAVSLAGWSCTPSEKLWYTCDWAAVTTTIPRQSQSGRMSVPAYTMVDAMNYIGVIVRGTRLVPGSMLKKFLPDSVQVIPPCTVSPCQSGCVMEIPEGISTSSGGPPLCSDVGVGGADAVGGAGGSSSALGGAPAAGGSTGIGGSTSIGVGPTTTAGGGA